VGRPTADNLGLACLDCNRFKGSDIASLDPASGELVRLFHPRTDEWSDHFEVAQGRIVPLTPIARATERLLKLNLPERIEVRSLLARAHLYPE
jgi:hypothetical protein